MKSLQWVVLVALGLSSALIDAREPRSRDADYGSQGGSESKEESRGGGRSDSDRGRGSREDFQRDSRRESPQVFIAQPTQERPSYNPGRTGGGDQGGRGREDSYSRRQAEHLQGQNDDARGNSRYVETRGQDRREDRQDRREDRWDRREDRIDRREDYWDAREDRHDRREDRRDYREDRRDNHRWNTWNDWYRHDYRQDHRYDYRYGNHRDDWHRSDWRRSWRHGWAGTRYRSPYRYYYPSGFSYRSWRIGYELPLAFLIADYFLDYRPYGLAPPPYGCRWLRVGDDVMLVDIRSGVIVDILYNFYY